MMNWWNSILISAVIISAGTVSVYAMGASSANIASLIFGFIWGFIIPRILDRGFRKEIMFKNKLYRFLRLRPQDIIGFPDIVEDKIMYYRKRSKLPFEELLKKIDKEMCLLALSFTLLTTTHIEDIRKLVAGGKHFTFLVLDPESDFVNTHSKLYRGTAANLKSQIENSLKVLWDLKTPYQDNITIKVYDDLAPLAIILIDDNIIKVEDRLVGRDAENRPSNLTYKMSNPGFYKQYHDEYDLIFKKARDYHPS